MRIRGSANFLIETRTADVCLLKGRKVSLVDRGRQSTSWRPKNGVRNNRYVWADHRPPVAWNPESRVYQYLQWTSCDQRRDDTVQQGRRVETSENERIVQPADLNN